MMIRRSLLPRLQAVLRAQNEGQWCPLSHPYSVKGKAAPLQERRMIDRFKVWAKGGDGGHGCYSIRRSRTDWRGKPDGGSGGRGGNVILECSPAIWDFSNLQHNLKAKKGGHGKAKKMIGTRGSDKVVQVPVGTVVHLVSGELPFMENTSTTSLQPWEIPDECEIEQSNSDGNTRCGGKELISDKYGKEDLTSKSSLSESYDKSPVDTILAEHLAKHHSCDISELKLHKGSFSYSEADESGSEEAIKSDNISETEPQEEDAVQYSVAELTEPKQRLIVGRGGEGGLGNAYFGKVQNSHKNVKHKRKSIDQLEVVNDEGDLLIDAQNSLTAGTLGTETVLILELKSIADIGLVGMPNAGKSTLLGAISRAKPAVGHYAFTTLRPNIGKMNYKDFFSVSVADIPGIIKGAHENRGLGHAFLRHIERTKVLAFVVDLAAALDGKKGIPPWEQLRDLVLELDYYQDGLSKRPSIVVANKIDEKGAEEVLDELKRRVHGVPIFPVCAVLEEGISELKDGLRRLMDGKESYTLKLDSIVVD